MAEPLLADRELAAIILLAVPIALGTSGRGALLRSLGGVFVTLATPRLAIPIAVYVVATDLARASPRHRWHDFRVGPIESGIP